MDGKYRPPFDLTDEIVNLTLDICQLMRMVQNTARLSKDPILRKENRIRSIHSSLAIEHNSLTEDQVTAIINGKAVIAPPREIKEIQNAFEVYESMDIIDPYSITELLTVHGIMMKDIMKDAGHFRSQSVGVYRGSELIHMGTRPEYVQSLMEELVNWAKGSSMHPLIKACLFHYEFEYIHPFSDGNGRTGRFWHTLILSKWEPILAWIPIENLILKRQSAYYKAISDSNNEGKSTIFITFMLQIMKTVLEENVGLKASGDVGEKEQLILDFLRANPKASAKAVAEGIDLSSRQVERIISNLKFEGKLERVGSNKTGVWKVAG